MSITTTIIKYIHNYQAIRMTAIATKIRIETIKSTIHRGNFTYPGKSISARIYRENESVGFIDYELSPLNDRIYINSIEIKPTCQRLGIGISTLWNLWLQYKTPLTPIHVFESATIFWIKARKRFARAGVVITDELRTYELNTEQQRWSHLVPEPEHEQLIRELRASPEWPAIQAEMKARHDL